MAVGRRRGGHRRLAGLGAFLDERLVAGLTIPVPIPISMPPRVASSGLFTGSEAELHTLLVPLLSAGTPGTPNVTSRSFLDAAKYFAGTPVDHLSFKNSSTLAYAPLGSAAIATFVDFMESSPTRRNLVQLFPFGAAVTAIDPAATAFVHRHTLFDLQYQAYWGDPADESDDVAWIGAFRAAMLPYTSGAYVNYIDADIPDWATAYYGANLPRLKLVKAAYDPDDIFQGPQSIPL